MKRKIELDKILSWRNSTDAQWAAIQAHSLTLAPIASVGGGRAVLWQHDSRQGSRFTECLDVLLQEKAKRHHSILETVAREREATVAAPIAAGNKRKLSQYVRFVSV